MRRRQNPAMDGHDALPGSAHLNLVLVTETWPPEINGVAMTLSRLVKGLAQRHWQVTLVRPRQRGEGKLATDRKITHMLVPGFPIPGSRPIAPTPALCDPAAR